MASKDLYGILQECLSNPASLEEVESWGYIKHHQEPDYSFSILKDLEQTYKISTSEVVKASSLGRALDIGRETASRWLHNYDIFLRAGGKPETLYDLSFCVDDSRSDKHVGAERGSALHFSRREQ